MSQNSKLHINQPTVHMMNIGTGSQSVQENNDVAGWAKTSF